jgi:penicillin-binding protein 2
MARATKTSHAILRIRLILGLMVAVQAGLAVFLWNLQVVRGHTFQENIRQQSMRRIRHPGQRGRIIDRNGIVIADNRPSVNLALYLEELRVPGPASRTLDRIETLLNETAAKIGLPRTLDREELARHYRNQRLLPLMAWKDLDRTSLARWAEQVGPQAGMDLYTEAVRTYPYRDLMAQTLGYVGRGGQAQDEEGRYDFQLPELEGKSGLELVFDERLRGEAGGELVRIDVAMYRHNVEAQKPAVPGQDVKLTIDARIQRLCERLLGEQTGSIVVMDPRNGEVLALATSPRFNLNDMTPFIPTRVWNRLTQDPEKPLVNRPVREHYPPGSVIKPFVCLAGLVYDQVDPQTVFSCQGVYYPAPGASPMHCHNRLGHGPLNMQEAIERSCNVYMWRMVEETGYDPFYRLLSEAGLGRPTGVEVDYETGGILPTDEWKQERFNDRLRLGDIANLSIGQGFLNVTPMQMAQLTSTLANGGTLVPPTLLKGFRLPGPQLDGGDEDISDLEAFIRPQPGRTPIDLGWPASSVKVIREGMRDVVMGQFGTARKAQVDGLVYAGKTGTAQFGRPGNRQYRSWMIAFAPYENPRYAAVVLIDAGQGSGVDAAPRMKLLMQALFRRTEASRSGNREEANRG